MKVIHHVNPAFSVLLTLIAGVASQPSPQGSLLRETVSKATSAETKGDALKKLFETTGKKGLSELMKDNDLGIALQAGWESHKRIVKRPVPINSRVDDIYDPTDLRAFLKFLKEKTKCPIPDWWNEDLVDVDVVPGRLHTFRGLAKQPALADGVAGGKVVKGAELFQRGGTVTYSLGKNSIDFPKETFGLDRNIPQYVAFTAIWTEKISVVTAYDLLGGMQFKVAGFESVSGKAIWNSSIWSVNRTILDAAAPHRIELVACKNCFYVFGEEPHGMYIESFDLATGKCLFRFSTSYWMMFSEKWSIR